VLRVVDQVHRHASRAREADEARDLVLGFKVTNRQCATSKISGFGIARVQR
jgi:hypothetical protein